MKIQHRFYKYRKHYAGGISEWEIIHLPDEEDPKHFFDEKYNWSDNVRRIEWYKIKCPPKDWLEKQIDRLQSRAGAMNNLADDYFKLLYAPSSRYECNTIRNTNRKHRF